MLVYLSKRQESKFPFLPIRGEKEKKLIYRKLKDIVAINASMSSESMFQKLTKDWNENEVCISSCIYPKLPCHFERYLKKWRKNTDVMLKLHLVQKD